MPALECRTCKTLWPDDRTEYNRCPDCQELTVLRTLAEPSMHEHEAITRKRHADFERWLEHREQRRKREGDALIRSLERHRGPDDDMPTSD